MWRNRSKSFSIISSSGGTTEEIPGKMSATHLRGILLQVPERIPGGTTAEILERIATTISGGIPPRIPEVFPIGFLKTSLEEYRQQTPNANPARNLPQKVQHKFL